MHRTSLDIPDDLDHAARLTAAELGVTYRHMLLTGLRWFIDNARTAGMANRTGTAGGTETAVQPPKPADGRAAKLGTRRWGVESDVILAACDASHDWHHTAERALGLADDGRAELVVSIVQMTDVDTLGPIPDDVATGPGWVLTLPDQRSSLWIQDHPTASPNDDDASIAAELHIARVAGVLSLGERRLERFGHTIVDLRTVDAETLMGRQDHPPAAPSQPFGRA